MSLDDDMFNYKYNMLVGNDFYYIDIWVNAITKKSEFVDLDETTATKSQIQTKNYLNNEETLRGKLNFQTNKTTYSFNNIYPLSREQYVDNFKRFKLKNYQYVDGKIKQTEEKIIKYKAKIEKLNKEIKQIEKKKYTLSKVMIKECLKYKGSMLTNILKVPLQESFEFVLKEKLFINEDEIIECYRELNIEKKTDDIDVMKNFINEYYDSLKENKKLLKTLKNKKLLMVVSEVKKVEKVEKRLCKTIHTTKTQEYIQYVDCECVDTKISDEYEKCELCDGYYHTDDNLEVEYFDTEEPKCINCGLLGDIIISKVTGECEECS